MTWVRIDDQMSINRKVAALSDAAFRLDREGLEWASRNLTDGVVLHAEFPNISRRATTRNAAELVLRGRWHRADDDACRSEYCPPPGVDGWVIHDYLEYNPSAVEVREDRRKKAEKQRNWRAGKGARSRSTDPSTNPQRDASRDGLVDGSVTKSVTMAPRAHVSRPVPPRPEGSGAGDRPVSPPAAFGDGAPAGGEDQDETRRPGPRCPTCGNLVASAYHRGACLAATRLLGSHP